MLCRPPEPFSHANELSAYRLSGFNAGYAALKNVETREKNDSIESFFLAETLKYLYLIYAPRSTLDLNKVVFNTEAHPLQKTW